MLDLNTFKAEDILHGLKDFQKTSAHNAFSRLFLDPKSTSRFLIADEVGLGKTIICKGLIALAIEHLKESVEFKNGNNIDIIYICSNLDIANQNIRKLNFINGQDSYASRITLIPEIYAALKPGVDPKKVRHATPGRVRFISFTPTTSFDLKQNSGWKKERALIFYLLRKSWNMTTAMDRNFFKDRAGADWEGFINGYENFWDNLDFGIFTEKFAKRVELYPDLKNEFTELRESFPRVDSKPDKAIRKRASDVIGKLRTILAEVCLEELSPDLVIMDEFQRFRDLFDDQTEVGKLALGLFDYPGVKNVLLSATPYKMYTISDEDEEDHYQDFLATTGWLLKDTAAVSELKDSLNHFRKNVFKKGQINWDDALKAKNNVETILRRVMSRTERVKVTKDSDSMISNRVLKSIPQAQELISFVELDEISKTLDLKGNVDYWKSSPHLLNVMENYDIKRRLKEKLHLAPVTKVLTRHSASLISKEAIENFSPISSNNDRLQTIKDQIFKNDSWKLLWLPPTAPYYKLAGVYAPFNEASMTKSLVFSSWKVVPRTISSLISHEAESKAFKAGPYDNVASYKNSNGLYIRKKEEKFEGLRTLALLYPSLFLIEAGDVFKLDITPTTEISVIKNLVKDKIAPELLKVITKYTKKDEKDDQNWYWIAPLLLDKESPQKQFILDWLDGDHGWRHPDTDNKDESIYLEHVQEFKKVLLGQTTFVLGQPPEDLLEKISLLALGGLANISYRSLRKLLKVVDPINELTSMALLFHSTEFAYALRSLLNSSEAISIIKSSEEDDVYWYQVLQYCVDGNLQSVCDEYVHILKIQHGFLDGIEVKSFEDDQFEVLRETFYDVVTMRQGRLDLDIFNQENGKFKIDKAPVRCKFALAYGDWKNDDGGIVSRAETVRDAFNSPFRPFVLATTSVGQEGLDFHQYCHSIFHWNLPRNPVDLEQREGRIHRFKGHVIRKNVASDHNILQYKNGDAWDEMFYSSKISKTCGSNDLVPYWIFDKKFKIERNVPLIPFSKDEQHFEALLKTLARYRLAFGQPRQDELLKVLEGNEEFDSERIKTLMIDLAP